MAKLFPDIWIIAFIGDDALQTNETVEASMMTTKTRGLQDDKDAVR